MDFKIKFTLDRELQSKEHDISDVSLLLKKLQRAYESDRGRIINSAAVRRLQQKTQVFPLERNAAVRSRLTHSLEVQQVGRFIVQSVFAELEKAILATKTDTINNSDILNNIDKSPLASYGLEGLERQIETVVEMSCLMHDIGNPPFGHFGEQAINDWFTRNFAQLLPKDPAGSLNVSEPLRRDICHFEGNAQGIRLVHSLQRLNLTYTQAAGILKYTRCGTESKPKSTAQLSYLQKKVGYYKSEEKFVAALQDKLSIQPGHRHPVAYIMEAADDISYCLADLEDAVEKNILNIEQLSQALCDNYLTILGEYQLMPPSPKSKVNMLYVTESALKKAKWDPVSANSSFFISLRIGFIHPMVNHAVDRFINNIEEVYQGSFNGALLEDNSHEHALSESFKRVALQYAFCHHEVETSELQGYRIITGLLDFYKPLLQLSRSDFEQVAAQKKQGPLLEKRLFKKLPGKHVRAFNNAVTENTSDEYEFYYRCRLIQDMISGMTDQYAFDEYRSVMVAG